jgi:CheY-like chemotaxis protein
MKPTRAICWRSGYSSPALRWSRLHPLKRRWKYWCEGDALPDLIVSDIAMPGEGGYSLMRRVRALDPEQGGRIQAIAVSAYSRTKDLMRALAAGFQAHLSKPVNAAELTHVITGLIGRFNRYQ